MRLATRPRGGAVCQNRHGAFEIPTGPSARPALQIGVPIAPGRDCLLRPEDSV